MSRFNRETRVALRDFVIFCVKLAIDGAKDGALIFLAGGAFAVDFIFRHEGDQRLFYKVMRTGEKFDRWLNLHGALEKADASKDGLFGASKAGSDTMLGKLEEVVRGGDEPRSRRGSRSAQSPPSGVEEDSERPGR